IDFGDAGRRDVGGARDADDADVLDAIDRVAHVAARERVLVARHRCDLVVAADHPEAAVALVERNRARAQRGPLVVATRVELGAVVVEVDRRPIGHVISFSYRLNTSAPPSRTTTTSRSSTPPTPNSPTQLVRANTIPDRRTSASPVSAVTTGGSMPNPRPCAIGASGIGSPVAAHASLMSRPV